MNTRSENMPGTCQFHLPIFCPAKINIGLTIRGRAPNGYHLLESLFWPISLYDVMTLAPASTPSVKMEWESNRQETISVEDNLVTRAMQLAGESYEVEIKKSIPPGAGLGGGSSNAGSFLRALDRPFSFEVLASQLGADVPFFLNPVPSLVSGIGEKIRPLSIPKSVKDSLSFLIVIPSFGISTKEAFNLYDRAAETLCEPVVPENELTNAGDLEKYLSECKNDLEGAVASHYPLIKNVLELLRRTNCLYAGMSGTGSTCFAVYNKPLTNTPKDIEKAFRTLHCRSVIAKTFTK